MGLDMTKNLKIILGALALAMLAACSSIPFNSDIPESIAGASTPVEHQRIADYFAKKAADYRAEAALHRKMAFSYGNRAKGDSTHLFAHCSSLANQFEKVAAEAQQLAAAHIELASSIPK